MRISVLAAYRPLLEKQQEKQATQEEKKDEKKEKEDTSVINVEKMTEVFDQCADIVPLRRFIPGKQWVLANPNYLNGKLIIRIKQVENDLARPDLVEADALLLALTDIEAIKLKSMQHHVGINLELYRNLRTPVISSTQKDRLRTLHDQVFITAVNAPVLEFIGSGVEEDGEQVHVLQ